MFKAVKPSFYVALLPVFLVLWSWVFWQGLKTAADIWFVSEIFNHCFFILPGAFYLIYRKKAQLSAVSWQPNYVVLPLILGCFLLYGVGIAGDIQLFMHMATFAILPFGIWFVLGNKAAFIIVYPLFFFFFAVPIGEELIPFLQQVTADISVFLLKLTGIPIFRTGLYIEIPNGRFLVAEACSGISFFIASIVIGTLYSHLNISHTKKKIGFICLSILFPIIANALRVYGIILVGYLTDMQHAVGADHLIYGGVFFSFVIICLLALGELFRDKGSMAASETDVEVEQSHLTLMPAALLAVTALMASLWYSLMSNSISPSAQQYELNLNDGYVSVAPRDALWKPIFVEPSSDFLGQFKEFDVYLAWYQTGQSDGELISSLNRFYHQDSWTIISARDIALAEQLSLSPFRFERISSPDGTTRLLTFWYLVGDRVFSNGLAAKLFQLQLTLLGNSSNGGVVVVSTEVPADKIDVSEQGFVSGISQLLPELNKAFPNEQ